MALGILAPELVVYNAWRQWDTATELTQEIRRMRSQFGMPLPQWTGDWNLVHSFFCVMGGFVVDMASTRPVATDVRPERLTLTPRGVLRSAELGVELPQLTREAIKDRSKADSLAKLLASLQAGSLACQLIGRVVNGLPVTELEVNTLGHVMCALILFVFWLRKPLDVKDPVVIGSQDMLELCAYWSMSLRSQKTGGWEASKFKQLVARVLEPPMTELTDQQQSPIDSPTKGKGGLQINHDSSGLLSDLATTPSRSTGSPMEVYARWPVSSDDWQPNDIVLVIADGSPSWKPDDIKETIQQYEPWRTVATKVYCSDAGVSSYQPRRLETEKQVEAFYVCLSLTELERWDLAWKGRLRDHDNPNNNLVERARNWSQDLDPLYSRRAWLVTPAIALATALYGGLHLLLWHAHFPSPTEKWLWRGSALIIAASGVAAIPFVLADNYGIDVDERSADLAKRWLGPVVSESSRRVLSRGGDVGYYLVMGTVLAVYGSARAFLVVEALISLRALPPAAYKTPDWSQWIPHL